MNISHAALPRREFLRSTMGAGAVAAGSPYLALAAPRPKERPSGKPKIAIIATVYHGYSHADVIAGRLIQGYLLNVRETYWPRTQVASMYVDQIAESDLSRAMAKQYGVRMEDSIEKALLLDSDQLAVDGVVIIGEHGNYPHNEKGQHMYPRRQFFEQTIRTFEKTGQTVPVFNDKHLGFAWQDAKWMYDQARQLDFPLMAGSSLPTAWRVPEMEYPLEVDLDECLSLSYGGIEAYGFHALETLQCMIERRRGGETGVRAVTCLEGDAVWKAAQDGRWSRDLLDAALKPLKNLPDAKPEKACKDPVAFLIEHADGLRSSVIRLDGYANTFGFAGKERGKPPRGTQFWLQEPVFGHFSYLVHNIEAMVLQRREIYPPERTLLTTGVLDAAMTSRHEDHRRVETPWLEQVAYRAPEQPGRRARFVE